MEPGKSIQLSIFARHHITSCPTSPLAIKVARCLRPCIKLNSDLANFEFVLALFLYFFVSLCWLIAAVEAATAAAATRLSVSWSSVGRGVSYCISLCRKSASVCLSNFLTLFLFDFPLPFICHHCYCCGSEGSSWSWAGGFAVSSKLIDGLKTLIFIEFTSLGTQASTRLANWFPWWPN